MRYRISSQNKLSQTRSLSTQMLKAGIASGASDVSEQSLIQRLFFSIGLTLCLFQFYLDASLCQLGFTEPYLERANERLVLRSVGIVINRCTLVRVVILVCQDITDPRLLEAIARDCVCRDARARWIPRYILRSMARAARTDTVSGWQGHASIAVAVRIYVYEHYFNRLGLRKDALRITTSHRVFARLMDKKIRREILRSGAKTFLSGLLCVLTAGLVRLNTSPGDALKRKRFPLNSVRPSSMITLTGHWLVIHGLTEEV